jgi:hypothetical protein
LTLRDSWLVNASLFQIGQRPSSGVCHCPIPCSSTATLLGGVSVTSTRVLLFSSHTHGFNLVGVFATRTSNHDAKKFYYQLAEHISRNILTLHVCPRFKPWADGFFVSPDSRKSPFTNGEVENGSNRKEGFAKKGSHLEFAKHDWRTGKREACVVPCETT